MKYKFTTSLPGEPSAETALVTDIVERIHDAKRRAFSDALMVFWEAHGRWPHWTWLEMSFPELTPQSAMLILPTVTANSGDAVPTNRRMLLGWQRVVYDTSIYNRSPQLEAAMLAEWASFREAS